VALLAAVDAAPNAVGALAPPCRIGDDPADPALDAVEALAAVDCPCQVVYGERDTTVDATPLVERARDQGHRIDAASAGHRLATRRVRERVVDLIADVFADWL